MNAIQLFHQDGRPTAAWYCPTCKTVARSQELAEQCCKPTMCACGNECERYYTKCKVCQDIDRDVKERLRFESATKIKDRGEPVYSEGLGYYDGYFQDLDTLRDDVDIEHCPNYVWTCDVRPTVCLHSSNILDNIEFPENQDKHSLEGIKELDEALEIFNDKNKDLTTWTPNYKECIIIRREE